MSTQLKDYGKEWGVSQVNAPGNRKKLARGEVRIPKGDKAALEAEIVRQVEEARRLFGIQMPLKELVD